MRTRAKPPRRKESAEAPAGFCALAPLREPCADARKQRGTPTFTLLREKRRLAVRNPENGARFTISLRDWQSMLWAVRVHPEPKWRQHGNAYTTAHRILPRTRIAEFQSLSLPRRFNAIAFEQVKSPKCEFTEESAGWATHCDVAFAGAKEC